MTNFINDWVRCNICFKGFDKEGGTLTSCGHFFCGRKSCNIGNVGNNGNIGNIGGEGSERIEGRGGNEGRGGRGGGGGTIICPICKNECGAISLSDSLPNDIIQFFEEPSDIITKAINVLKFHNHQKELARLHFEKAQTRIRELEEEIYELKRKNQQLFENKNLFNEKENQEQRKNTEMKSVCYIPEIIAATMSTMSTTSTAAATSTTSATSTASAKSKITKMTKQKKMKTNHQLFNTSNLLKNDNDNDNDYDNDYDNNDIKSSIEKKSTSNKEPISKLFTPTLASRLQHLTGKKLYSPVQQHD